MEKRNKKKTYRLLLKWGRLVLAIVSSILLLSKPVLNFIDEKGLMNLRTYEMQEEDEGISHQRRQSM